MMKHTLTAVLLLGATALVAAHSAESPTLPAKLELRYVLHYGNLKVGRVSKTLIREADGRYRHQSHSVPLGAAKIFTSVEWFEEGQFEVVQGKLQPLSFLEYRTGGKAHRHSARFDWKEKKIFYANGVTVPLPPGTQDNGSLLYALMLNPPRAGSAQAIHISSGKKLRVYRHTQTGSETLKTVFGDIKTTVIERPADDQEGEGFRVWLATEQGNLPVRIRTEKRGQETVLELESVSGL